MSTLNFFRDLKIEETETQSVMVDSLLEKSPILEMLPMQASTHKLQNAYEDLISVSGAQISDLDAPLAAMDLTSTLKYQDLNVIGGEISVGEDKANALGGAADYFTKKMPKILQKTGQETESSLVYNSTIPYAKANSRQLLAESVTADVNYSIVAVRWEPGETTGLYSTDGFGNGKLFDMQALNNGGLMKVDNGSGTDINGFAMRIKTYFGYQLANPKTVSSIRNNNIIIDTSTATGRKAIATESQIDDMLDLCEADASNTFIYMHPNMLSALNVYKGGALQMTPSDMDFNRAVNNWNGIRIITSRNFSRTEALATA